MDKSQMERAASKEMAAMSQATGFIGVEADLHNWSVEDFLVAIELGLANPQPKVGNSGKVRRSAPVGTTATAATMKGNDDITLRLNAINRICWKLLFNESGRLLYPSMSTDVDDDLASFTSEIGARLRGFIEDALVSEKLKLAGGQEVVDERLFEYFAKAKEVTMGSVNYVNEGLQNGDKEALAILKKWMMGFPSPMSFAKLIIDQDDENLKTTLENIAAHRERKGKQEGLEGDALKNFVEGTHRLDGTLNVPTAVFKMSEEEAEVAFLDLVEQPASIEDKLLRAETFKLFFLKKGWDIEVINDFIMNCEANAEITKYDNAINIATSAWETVHQAIMGAHAPRLMIGGNTDTPLPDAVESLLLDKFISTFDRKIADCNIASEDFLYGTNNSGYNRELALRTVQATNSSEYWAEKAKLWEKAFDAVDNRLYTKQNYQEVQGNSGVLEIDGQLHDTHEEDEFDS